MTYCDNSEKLAIVLLINVNNIFVPLINVIKSKTRIRPIDNHLKDYLGCATPHITQDFKDIHKINFLPKIRYYFFF